MNEESVKDAILRITSINGIIVKEIELKSNTNQNKISTTSWVKGIYYISIIANNKVIKTLNIVVE